MKKIYMFLLLLFSVVSMTAQTMPAISDAPSDPENGVWADNTTWYFVKCGNGCYLDAKTRYNNSSYGNLALSKTTKPTDDNGWWCLVGDETNGYYLYNKGYGKVLSLLEYSTDAWCWAAMEAVSASSYPNKQFKFQASEFTLDDADYWCLKDADTTSKNRWLCKTQDAWNSPKISFWDKDNALTSADAAFTFIPAVEAEEAKPITAISELSNEKCYTVVTYSRGAWTATVNGISHSGASNPETYPAHRFAFLSNDGGVTYYLYNVGYQKFINKENNLTDRPVDPIQFITPGAYDKTFVLYFDNSHFINIDGNGNVIIDGWGPGGTNSYGCADEGNSCYITPYEEFDPSEALAAFGVEESVMQALISEAENALAHSGVGYPLPTSPARGILQTAIDQAKADLTSPTYYGNLEIALDEYGISTEVLLPEDGKAYTITSIQKNGNRYYMNHSGSTIIFTGNPGMATPFVCRRLNNGKYVFVDNKGKYLIWRGNGNDGTNTEGCMDSYDSSADAYTDLQVNKMVTGSGVSVNGRDLLGYLTIFGRRNSNAFNYLTIKSDGSFDQTGVAFYSDNSSAAFILTEADYANNVELKTADGIDNVNAIATFSAPFPTIVPSGVTAWYVCQDSLKKENVMTMTALKEGKAIPANSGVILTGNEGYVRMQPAAGEAETTLTNNLLKSTAGNDTEVSPTENAFIIGKADNLVAFYPLSGTNRLIQMNKAYIVLPTSASSVKMNFDFNTTAIERVETLQPTAGAIYDISGRRVVKTVKGGLYISNGKKFVAQ